MKRYKIMVYTIQGHQLFFCHWKMGNSYSTRFVPLRGDSIFYFDNELTIAENYLKNNLEKLQVKTYTIDEVTHQPTSVKASKRAYTRIFGQNDRNIERNGAIL
jgi:hypothetical protein